LGVETQPRPVPDEDQCSACGRELAVRDDWSRPPLYDECDQQFERELVAYLDFVKVCRAAD
jgi:hypothetical protein